MLQHSFNLLRRKLDHITALVKNPPHHTQKPKFPPQFIRICMTCPCLPLLWSIPVTLTFLLSFKQTKLSPPQGFYFSCSPVSQFTYSGFREPLLDNPKVAPPIAFYFLTLLYYLSWLLWLPKSIYLLILSLQLGCKLLKIETWTFLPPYL